MSLGCMVAYGATPMCLVDWGSVQWPNTSKFRIAGTRGAKNDDCARLLVTRQRSKPKKCSCVERPVCGIKQSKLGAEHESKRL